MKALISIIFLFSLRAHAVEEFILDGLPEVVQQDTGTPANSKPLPVGPLNVLGVQINPSTEEKQDDVITELMTANGTLTTIDTVLDSSYLVQQGIESELQTTNGYLLSIDGKLPALSSGRIPVEVGGTVPLPTGAATEATLQSIDSKLTSPITVSATDLDIRDLSSATDSVSAVQSGTWNITNVSGTVSLPTGASTEAKQDDTITELQGIATDTGSIDGKLPATLGQETMANSLAVVIASDQSTLNVSSTPVSNTATFDQITNLSTSAQTFTAPSNAVGFKIQSPSSNTANVVWRVDGTATATAGILMEPGRSEDFDAAGNISVIAVSGTQTITVQWKVHP